MRKNDKIFIKQTKLKYLKTYFSGINTTLFINTRKKL